VYQILIPDTDPEKRGIRIAVDSDWADDRITRESCSGGILYYAEAPLLSWARTQASIALSSAEAELYGIGTGCVEGLGLKQIITEMSGRTPTLIIETDSKSAKAGCARRGPGRMTHIELRMLAVQDWVAAKLLSIRKVCALDNSSDILTKAMTKAKLVKLGRLAGLRGVFFDDVSYDGA
jgi:hypothetical protein